MTPIMAATAMIAIAPSSLLRSAAIVVRNDISVLPFGSHWANTET